MSLPTLQNLIFYNCNFQNFSFTIANQFHNWQTPTSQMSQSRGGNEKVSLLNLKKHQFHDWQTSTSQKRAQFSKLYISQLKTCLTIDFTNVPVQRWQWNGESAQFAKLYILQLQFSKLQFHNWQTPTSQLNVLEQGWQWKGESAQFAKLAKPISQFPVKTNGPQSIAPRLSCYLRIKPNGHKWGSIVVEISPPPI